MIFESLHEWNLNNDQAVNWQRILARQVVTEGVLNDVTHIAGFDVSVHRNNEAIAAAVILSYPELTVVETARVRGKISFPYIPGLLSFRETPLVLQACEKIKTSPDLIIVDGQGIAHPRQFGLAAHIGLWLDIPTIGCAKSHLFGRYTAPPDTAGSYSCLANPADGLILGAAVRTKTGIKPVFVSVGHKIALSSAIDWVLQCCHGYRLPEPTRQAHLASREKSIQKIIHKE